MLIVGVIAWSEILFCDLSRFFFLQYERGVKPLGGGMSMLNFGIWTVFAE
jgi:hypothetical protein